jgi:8-oxo-dGTP pyrophosphatase MutT (NUDIX family)
MRVQRRKVQGSESPGLITEVTISRMAREFSAGGVAVRRMRGRWWVAAIEPRKDQPGKAVTALPKGLVDAGEEPEQTALREVEEETGIRTRLVGKLGDIKYVYVRSWGDGSRVFKIVSFYLLLYRSGRLDDIQPETRHEVRRALWLPLEEAPQQLSYRGERDMVRRAQEYVAEHADLQ